MLAGGQEKFASSIYKSTAFFWLLNIVMKLNLFSPLILNLHLNISVQWVVFFQMKNSFLLGATWDKRKVPGMELGDFFKDEQGSF